MQSRGEGALQLAALAEMPPPGSESDQALQLAEATTRRRLLVAASDQAPTAFLGTFLLMRLEAW